MNENVRNMSNNLDRRNEEDIVIIDGYTLPEKIVVPFFSLSLEFRPKNEVHPRKESFWKFLHSFFCPNLTSISATLIIIIIYIIVYIAELLFGIEESNLSEFLPIKYETMEDFGCYYPELMKESIWQNFRWLANILIHSNFFHLLLNCVGLLGFSTVFEKCVPQYKVVIIFIGSGVLGTLSTVFFSSARSNIGSNTAVYGLLGGFCAFYVSFWKELDNVFEEWEKCYFIYIVIMYFLISFLCHIQNFFINAEGHVTGFIFGVLIYLAMTKPVPGETIMKVFRICNWIFLFVFSCVGIVYFYSFSLTTNRT